MNTPRLRIFAGPNGSGKSTLKSVINDNLLGVYINPDEIEKEIKQFDFLNFTYYQVEAKKDEILKFFNTHPLIKKANLEDEVIFLRFNENKLSFFEVEVNSYYASICADFIRQKLLQKCVSFTFETVMSSKDKISLLKKAQQMGYKTYLYFITTQDPIINISRVKNRVILGGHDVPEHKIVDRYYKSMKLLKKAIRYSNRAYIFDNSSLTRLWLAQIDDGKNLELKSEALPVWFKKYILDES